MTADRAAEMHGLVDSDWTLEENRIERRFKFKNFRDAFGFATRIAMLAEEEGHHPDMKVGWGYVSVKLTTHAAKGLTDNDFILAAKIDHL